MKGKRSLGKEGRASLFNPTRYSGMSTTRQDWSKFTHFGTIVSADHTLWTTGMTYARGLVHVLHVVDRKADKSRIEKRTVEWVSLVARQITGDIPGFKDDLMTIYHHAKVVVAMVRRLLGRLVHAGVETTIERSARTPQNSEKKKRRECVTDTYLSRVVLPAELSPMTAIRTRFGPTEEARLNPPRMLEKL